MTCIHRDIDSFQLLYAFGAMYKTPTLEDLYKIVARDVRDAHVGHNRHI